MRRVTDKSYIDGEQTQLLPVPLKIPAVPPEFNQPAPGRYNMVAQKQYLLAKANSARIA
ncbi:hypothetical protein [uncultured Desulfobulbus sp.]|uniref:hypothetical protein n=1 Tax=uncultured Desulfobulbus sp. TaxID=239745 RepID=UPI0029C7D821|nr:hypothetical protein [uncultured Desulfobulbus sp.]